MHSNPFIHMFISAFLESDGDGDGDGDGDDDVAVAIFFLTRLVCFTVILCCCWLGKRNVLKFAQKNKDWW